MVLLAFESDDSESAFVGLVVFFHLQNEREPNALFLADLYQQGSSTTLLTSMRPCFVYPSTLKRKGRSGVNKRYAKH
jgi:hypothetical protein